MKDGEFDFFATFPDILGKQEDEGISIQRGSSPSPPALLETVQEWASSDFSRI